MNHNSSYEQPFSSGNKHDLKKIWQRCHLDVTLLVLILFLTLFGLIILYSASNESQNVVVHQLLHFAFAFICLIIAAQIHPQRLMQLAPWLYGFSLALLLMVPVIGHSSQGAKRWIGTHSFQIQPSEFMKLAMPMMTAWVLDREKLPPNGRTIVTCLFTIAIPVLLIAKQPDLGTAIIIGMSGIFVLILSGINWKLIVSAIIGFIISCPILWHFLHDYQKKRILTLLDPSRDPLGSGYNIIQSKIAVGSGGVTGKGWLHGTQAHLAFLPTHTTDFIFAVNAEEFGLIGAILLITLLFSIFLRSILISIDAPTSFNRLLCGSLSCTFIMSGIINIGMVIGILPVVGIPLPLVSYGGSYLVTIFIGFGILMSSKTHKKLWSS